jgi:uncharacterized membrane protein
METEKVRKLEADVKALKDENVKAKTHVDSIKMNSELQSENVNGTFALELDEIHGNVDEKEQKIGKIIDEVAAMKVKITVNDEKIKNLEENLSENESYSQTAWLNSCEILFYMKMFFVLFVIIFLVLSMILLKRPKANQHKTATKDHVDGV